MHLTVSLSLSAKQEIDLRQRKNVFVVNSFFYKNLFYEYFATIIDKCVLLLNCTSLMLKMNSIRYNRWYLHVSNNTNLYVY